MKKTYTFANAKPVLFGKIDYWIRTGKYGLHKSDYKPNLKGRRIHMASLRRDRKIMTTLF